MAKYILGLDQGTTSSRAILFDEAGQPVASAQEEFTQHFPKPGWVEHDPHDIWRTQRDTARAVLDRVKVSAADVAAISITNQRETTMIWDRKTGEPVHNAIVWQCRRTAPMCDRIKAESLLGSIFRSAKMAVAVLPSVLIFALGLGGSSSRTIRRISS